MVGNNFDLQCHQLKKIFAKLHLFTAGLNLVVYDQCVGPLFSSANVIGYKEMLGGSN